MKPKKPFSIDGEKGFSGYINVHFSPWWDDDNYDDYDNIQDSVFHWMTVITKKAFPNVSGKAFLFHVI
ncbi:MAG: hypothetical protein AAF502_18140 [Bacteroidota bacterium]